MKAMSAPTKKENTDARDGIREGDRGQRARPAARRRDDRDVRGDGQVQRGAGEGRGDDRRRWAQAFVGGQADRLRRCEPDGDRKSDAQGESVSVPVDLGGRRIIKKKKHIFKYE